MRWKSCSLASVGLLGLFAAGCSAPQGQLLYITNGGGQPLTAFETNGAKETRICEVPAGGTGGPGFLRAGEARHTVILRDANGAEAQRVELAPETVWTVGHQAHEAFFVCLGYGERTPYAGRDPRRDPRDDATLWAAPIRRINPIAALGLCGWVGTVGTWMYRRRTRTTPALGASVRR